jgi:hypothetical protein
MRRHKQKQSNARATCHALRQQIDEQLTPRACDIPDYTVTYCGNYTVTMCGDYSITQCG